MTSPEVDDTAADAFFAEFGEAARKLPPVAIVIAAYNEAGAIGPVIDRTYDLADIVEAHRYVDTGRKRGSVVVRIPGGTQAG